MGQTLGACLADFFAVTAILLSPGDRKQRAEATWYSRCARLKVKLVAGAETAGAVVETATSLRGWADVIRERFIPLQIAQRDASDLAGSVRSRQIGHLQASIVDSVPQTFTRTRRLISAGGHDLLALGVVERGTGYLEQDGRNCMVSGGDFALYETSRPFTWSLAGDWRLRVYTWPRETVALTEPDSQQLTATVVPGDAGVGRFLSPMLADLTRTGAGLSPSGSIRLASEIAELSVIAALEAGQAVKHERPDRDQLREIQAFIEQNLADPALTPPRIAGEFYMSARTLHRLFARHGITVAAWIKSRRLEACRRALVSPGSKNVPINEIASRFGFSNQAFFSREFSRQYGQSPRRHRLHGRG
jgi:AraC-like DNA-binding protein